MTQLGQYGGMMRYANAEQESRVVNSSAFSALLSNPKISSWSRFSKQAENVKSSLLTYWTFSLLTVWVTVGY